MSEGTRRALPALRAACLLLAGLVLLGGCRGPQPEVTIPVVMKKWKVEPEVIRIPRGQWVALVVSTPDVQHGFHVPTLGIKEPVQPRMPATILLKVDEPGEHKVECDIICGPGHDDMIGKIVVE
jgi:cytochrome c oxidase subunit 2